MDGRSQVQATDDSYFSRLGKELMITLISVRVNAHFSYFIPSSEADLVLWRLLFCLPDCL
jgi:hypothetical protein